MQIKCNEYTFFKGLERSQILEKDIENMLNIQNSTVKS